MRFLNPDSAARMNRLTSRSACTKAVANRPRRSTATNAPHIWEGNLSGTVEEVSTSHPTDEDAVIALQYLERSFGKGSQLGGTRFLWTSEVLPVLFLQTEEKPKQRDIKEKKPEYFANVGDAIRTLRDDIPDLFTKDLHCEYAMLFYRFSAWTWSPILAKLTAWLPCRHALMRHTAFGHFQRM